MSDPEALTSALVVLRSAVVATLAGALPPPDGTAPRFFLKSLSGAPAREFVAARPELVKVCLALAVPSSDDGAAEAARSLATLLAAAKDFAAGEQLASALGVLRSAAVSALASALPPPDGTALKSFLKSLAGAPAREFVAARPELVQACLALAAPTSDSEGGAAEAARFFARLLSAAKEFAAGHSGSTSAVSDPVIYSTESCRAPQDDGTFSGESYPSEASYDESVAGDAPLSGADIVRRPQWQLPPLVALALAAEVKAHITEMQQTAPRPVLRTRDPAERLTAALGVLRAQARGAFMVAVVGAAAPPALPGSAEPTPQDLLALAQFFAALEGPAAREFVEARRELAQACVSLAGLAPTPTLRAFETVVAAAKNFAALRSLPTSAVDKSRMIEGPSCAEHDDPTVDDEQSGAPHDESALEEGPAAMQDTLSRQRADIEALSRTMELLKAQLAEMRGQRRSSQARSQTVRRSGWTQAHLNSGRGLVLNSALGRVRSTSIPLNTIPIL